MAEKFLDIQTYTWWEADTMNRWPAKSFYEWSNIEIRKDLTGFSLSPVLEDTWWTLDGDITYMESLETLWINNWGIIVCTDTGKIYLDGVLKTTLATGTDAHDEILTVWVNEDTLGTQYIYYISKTSFGAWEIHRSTTDLSTFNVWYRTYTTSSWNPEDAFVINNVWLLYIGVKNVVFIMDKDEIVLDYLNLPDQEEIKGISMYLWNFRIYANSKNTGIQYIWDWASELPRSRQEWSNQPVMWITNDWPTDYAILGFNENYADFYRIDGTQKTELRVNLESSSDARIFDRYMSIREGIIYISWGKSWQSDDFGIYTYGNYFPWTAKSLVQSYWLWSDSFLYHAHNSVFSYFACNDDKVYKIDHSNPPGEFASEWYITTLVYDGGALWDSLSLDKIKMAFKTNWGAIKIYARTSFTSSSTFHLIKTIDNSTYWQERHCHITINEIIRSGVSLWEFQEIQFKIVLERGVSTSNNPICKRFTAWFKVNNDN